MNHIFAGARNHPAREPARELLFMSESGFDFVHFSFEPPMTDVNSMDVDAVRQALVDSMLDFVGRGTSMAPLSSPLATVREAGLRELNRQVDMTRRLGGKLFTYRHQPPHPDMDQQEYVHVYSELLKQLVTYGSRNKIQVALANASGSPAEIEVLGQVFDRVSDLKFALDVGHANLETPENASVELLAAFGSRLAHVMASENDGTDDQHLPIESTMQPIDWAGIIKALQDLKFERWMTIDVFSADKGYLVSSRDRLDQLWVLESKNRGEEPAPAPKPVSDQFLRAAPSSSSDAAPPPEPQPAAPAPPEPAPEPDASAEPKPSEDPSQEDLRRFRERLRALKSGNTGNPEQQQ